MQGFSLRNVTLTVYDEHNKQVYSDLGEMLFTHFGVSGPLVLSASAHMRDFSQHSYRLSIDLKPALVRHQLVRMQNGDRLLRWMKRSSTRASCVIFRNMPTGTLRTRSTISRVMP